MKRIIALTIVLASLAACTTFRVQNPEPNATGTPLVNMPNPASVYCLEKGNKLEIRTASDGSQFGVCIFPDGSTCDEWAYYRADCSPQLQSSPTPATSVEATPEAGGSRPGGNASSGTMPPGTSEKIADWWGVIKSTKPGSQYDDYFERLDLGQIICFGIDSTDPALNSQIKALRDSGKIVHLYGTLVSNVPDYNGSQIQVARLKVE